MFTTLTVMVIIALGLLVAPYKIARRSERSSPPPQQDDHDTHEQR